MHPAIARARQILATFNPDQPRDDHGRWSDTGGGTGYEFVSPNVQNINFTEAVAALESERQATLRKASGEINDALSITATESSVVGAWADGAENSVMDVVPKADWDKLTLSAAMKGWLANQKAILVFRHEKGGGSAMFRFEAKGDLGDIHKGLLDDGVAFHTLVPHAGGATVYVVSMEQSASEAQAVDKGAARHDASITFWRGRAEFIGTTKDGTDQEQRDDARRVYEVRIGESTVSGSAGIWDRIRDRWGQAADAKEVKSRLFDEGQHPRDDHGRWTFAGGPSGEKWQSVATAARKAVLKEHPRYKALTVRLRHDLDEAMKEAENYQDMKNWYGDYKPLADELFQEHSETFSKFLAASSAGLAGEANVKEALRALEHHLTGGKFDDGSYKPTGLYAQSTLSNYVKVQKGEALAGRKVPHFFANLTGDLSEVTGDRHMARLLFGVAPTNGLTDAQEATMQAVIAAMADKLGWQPAELQAALWAVQKAREDGGMAADIWTYNEILLTHAASIRALVGAHAQKDAPDGNQFTYEKQAEAFDNAAILLALIDEIQKHVGPTPSVGDVRDLLQMEDEKSIAAKAILARARTVLGFDPNEPRDDHGRWTDGGGSDDTAAAKLPDIHGDMSIDHGTAKQPVKSLDELYERSKAGEAAFIAELEQAAETTGGKLVLPPAKSAEPGSRSLKNRKAAEIKMNNEANGDPTQLKDIMRGTIVHDTIAGSRVAVASFIRDIGDRVVRVKDRIVNPTAGYRDFLVNFKTEDGLVAELQFIGDHMIQAKFGDGHKIYERLRAVPKPPVAEILKLEQESVAIYENAYKEDGNGNWGKKAA